jgi:type II secretory pathway pseudopilin PulG
VRPTSSTGERGFSLVEVLVATGMLVTVLVGVARLVSMAARANLAARHATVSSIVASAKLEELRSAPWAELGVTPPGTLDGNQTGYYELLDATGRALPGAFPESQAVYVRRWAVARLPSAPSDALVISVLGAPWTPGLGVAGRRPAGAALVATLRRRSLE